MPAPVAPPRTAAGTAPGKIPVLGHAIALLRQPLEFLTSLPAHGDLVEVRLGPRRAFMVCRPELAQQVLLNPRTFDKGGPLFEAARLLVGNGLVTSGWAENRIQRRLVQPAFHPGRMAAYVGVMREEIDDALAAWETDRAFDLNAALHALTIRVTMRTLFSTTIGSRAVAEVQHCLPVVLGGIYRRMIAPIGLLHQLPTPGNRQFDQARARLRTIIDATVQARRSSGSHNEDLVSILIGAQDEENGKSFTDDEIRDQVMTLLIGGTETTASALAWALHLLGRHPEAEQELQTEVDAVLGERMLPDFHDLPALDYTRRTITEALRLYPPAWILTRTTTVATELAGKPLAPGTIVLFSPYVLGRDPHVFPDPERFDPDRWLPGRVSSAQRGAMVPFSAGSRKCIGDSFGMAEATLALAAVSARWQLRPVPGTVVRPKPKAALNTGPLLMLPRQRARPAQPAACPGRCDGCNDQGAGPARLPGPCV
ncbi:pentalenene oxygenase [Streptomyces sp. SLBN-118]|uniref:cytochrome P450 n=1 Tax=Streptomyces sp. SLBN-118 TaxID=2768454 RepID=UPI001154EA42|nr:cytochrome P450 [Streptomyces sp. SLBN-118]TQK50161.1 pentalenene oxygenase [Streptomyces sp. SLBN-118]